jgi:hypothetical protein
MNTLLEDYARWIQDFIDPLCEMSKRLADKDLVAHTELLKQVAKEQKTFVQMALTKTQPADQQLVQDMARPMLVCLAPLLEFAGQHRASSWFHHLSAISEGSLAFNWVFIVGTQMWFSENTSDLH